MMRCVLMVGLAGSLAGALFSGTLADSTGFSNLPGLYTTYDGSIVDACQPRDAVSQTDQSPVHEPADFNIVLGRPTQNAIALNLLSGVDAQVAIRFGVQPGSSYQQTANYQVSAGTPFTVELKDLEPDTQYFYCPLINGAPGELHRFHTQRGLGKSFSFIIEADPHNRDPRFESAIFTASLNGSLQQDPDFFVDLGDTFMTEKARPQSYAEAEQTFVEMRPFLSQLAADAPLFLVNGNHEGELGWLRNRGDAQQLPLWSVRLRQAYYPGPVAGEFYSGSTTQDPNLGSPRDGYYAFTWGDALFVVLDPFWYTSDKPKAGETSANWNWTLGEQQYRWLAQTLAGNNSRFKFVFIHHLVGGGEEARGGVEVAPLFEWGGLDSDGTYGFGEHRAGWESPIHNMLVKNGVSAVFHGHDHFFARQDLDGVIYQECPQPSVVSNGVRQSGEYGYHQGDSIPGSGFIKVTVNPQEALVEFFRVDTAQLSNPPKSVFSYTVYPARNVQ